MSFQTYLTELVHLRDVEKDNPGIVKKLLADHIVVNIKIDQASLVVMRDGEQLRFYGRDGKEEISKIKRVGMDLYKKPIAHLEASDWKKLPEGVMVFLENFNDKLKSIMTYTEKPHNELIVSYCKKGSKVYGPADPINELAAAALDVAPPPVIFNGKLNSVQREALDEYVRNPNKPFLEFITSLFVTPKQLHYLVKENFEGLVFYFNDEKVPSAKLVDPEFTQKIMDKKEEESAFNEILLGLIFKYTDRALSEVLSTKLKGADEQDRIIDAVGKLTVKLVKSHHAEFKKLLDTFAGEVEAKRFTNVDYEQVPAKVNELIKEDFWVEELFRTLLFMFAKTKKRADPRSGITLERKNKINTWIEMVKGQ